MQTIFVSEFSTPCGVLLMGSYKEQLCLCDWKYRAQRNRIDKRICTTLHANYQYNHSCKTIAQTQQQLNEYFNRTRTKFELPLLFIGTEFQKKVWDVLCTIPYGKTETYASLSMKLNTPLAIRAVAAANGTNAISIIVPCHRIIGSNRQLIGYAGGLAAKKKLLELESVVTNKQPELFV